MLKYSDIINDNLNEDIKMNIEEFILQQDNDPKQIQKSKETY